MINTWVFCVKLDPAHSSSLPITYVKGEYVTSNKCPSKQTNIIIAWLGDINIFICRQINSFIHHFWGETVLWGAVFIIQTSDYRMQYFTTLRYKLLFRIIEARVGFSRKPLKKFQNHLYGQPVLTFTVLAVVSVWMNINRVTLQDNKEFIMFIFYFKTV